MVDYARLGHDDTGDGTDRAEGDGEQGVIAESAEVLCGSEDVQADEEDVSEEDLGDRVYVHVYVYACMRMNRFIPEWCH